MCDLGCTRAWYRTVCHKYDVQEKQRLNTGSLKPQSRSTVTHIVNGDSLLVFWGGKKYNNDHIR